MQYRNIFATRQGIIIVGLFIGIVASVLQLLGNPGNMGICVACFERDIAGAVGFHQAKVVQYMRPEIIGFVLGALIAAYIFKEFKPRSGSAPVIRYFLGIFAMIGALVFLGCPWRALLRLAGGDLNAIFGLAGLVFGIWIGTLFLKRGYNLGRSQPVNTAAGWMLPVLMVIFLFLLLIYPEIPGQDKNGVLFFSVSGPGMKHAPVIISLAAGLGIGFLAQRSRFCTMGALRDLILFKQFHLFSGFMALLLAAFISNLLFNQFVLGFENQPVAHNLHLGNFAGMSLAGLCFTLAGGCPGRHLFLSGEGDGDAAIFVLGMITGAGFAHNFSLASSPNGLGQHGIAALVIGFIFSLFIGFAMSRKKV
ncbi:MAG: YedE-related selenium metabolism membrane protein [Calditrichaceae bacterium]|nr:YedE-related selenium metabolism membrane protein [Calditrichaceae bacterium]MBN2710503.1 YedE-related selenium metabolism membrane protein [Calditrichaceae bacterium]RQV97295.1 MAG: YedE-related selenium metabolism membrane protein [Calditrichota bacterium]